MNVLFIWDRMGHYHFARIKALQKLYPDYRIFSADLLNNDNLYRWNPSFDESVHFRLSPKNESGWSTFSRIKNGIAVIKKKKIKYVALAGYGRIEYILITLWAKLTGLNVLLFAESWYKSTIFMDRLKSVYLENFVDGVMVSGTSAFDHFTKKLGYPEGKISRKYSVVDNEHFANEVRESQFPFLPEKPYILTVARYAPEKNLETLIRAYKKSDIREAMPLYIIGDGPLKSVLEKEASGSGVYLTGWKTYEELPLWYKRASIFVLPSLFEPWGLVVNEAMAAGLPVVVSSACGCHPDLVNKGNGWVFDPRNEDELVDLLNKISKLDPSSLQEMGSHSRNAIKQYGLNEWSVQFHQLIEEC